MTHTKPRIFLMSVFGNLVLGKPLPLRANAFGQRIVPIAEVLPETFENRQQYSIKAFGQMADMSRSSIHRAIKSKCLKARKQGRRTVIPYEAAMEFLGSQPLIDSQADGSEDKNAHDVHGLTGAPIEGEDPGTF